MSEITIKRALDVMCQVVGEFGVDYMYTKINDKCLNWDSEKDCPSCLIGHVLHRLGVSREMLVEHEAKGAGSVLHYFKSAGGTFEDGLQRVLDVAQITQDSDRTWGYALMRALNEYDRVRRDSAWPSMS